MTLIRILKNILIILLFVLSGNNSIAQISISPIILEKSVYGGATKDFPVQVYNQSPENLDCTISLHSMKIGDGGLPLIVNESPRDCSDWITVEPAVFQLPAGQGINLRMRFQVPKGSEGGYYGIMEVFAKPLGGDNQDNPTGGVKAGVRFNYRSLMPILLAVPGGLLQAEIAAVPPVIETQADGRTQLINLPVFNKGNIHAKMKGQAEIRSLENQLIEEFELTAGSGYVLPDHERVLKHTIKSFLPDGQYVMNVRLNLERSSRPLSKIFQLYVRDGEMQVGEPDKDTLANLAKYSAGFFVMPQEIVMSMQPKSRRIKAFTVTNLTKEEIPLSLTIMDWARQADGTDYVLQDEAPHGHSIKKFISLRQEEVVLRPLGKLRIPVTVTFNESFSGEGYAAVTINRRDRELSVEPNQRARRSVRIRAYVPKTGSYSMELLRFNAQRQPNGVITMETLVTNTGSLGTEANLSIDIRDSENFRVGRVLDKTKDNLLIQAGMEKLVISEFREILEPGEYTADLTVNYGTGARPLSARSKFTVPALGNQEISE